MFWDFVAPDMKFNFIGMVLIVGERGQDLGERQVGEAVLDLCRIKAKPAIFNNRANGCASAADNRLAAEYAFHADNLGVNSWGSVGLVSHGRLEKKDKIVSIAKP